MGSSTMFMSSYCVKIEIHLNESNKDINHKLKFKQDNTTKYVPTEIKKTNTILSLINVTKSNFSWQKPVTSFI